MKKLHPIRFLSILLVWVLLIQLLPLNALATEFAPIIDFSETTESIETEDGSEAEKSLSKEISATDDVNLRDIQIIGEVIENRTEYSKEFKLSNGLHMATIYAEAVHYNKEGIWENIDNTLQLAEIGGVPSYTNTAGGWDIMFPQQLSDDCGVTITKDGYTLQFFMAGEMHSIPGGEDMFEAEGYPLNGMQTEESGGVISDSPEESVGRESTEEYVDNESMDEETVKESLYATDTTMSTIVTQVGAVVAEVQSVDSSETVSAEFPEMMPSGLHSRITYADIYDNTDIIYDLSANQLKESIVIQQYDDSLLGYQYNLKVGEMLPVITADGRIELYDETGKNLVMVMPAPYLIDDANEYCYSVEVGLQKSDDSYILTYTLPQSWLADSDRQWPVILDPIVSATSVVTNIKDVSVYSALDSNHGEGIIQCGYRPGWGKMRFYLKYIALPELTSGDVIVNAAIQLYKPADSGTSTSVEVHKVTETWESETMNWDNQAACVTTVEDFAVCKNAGYYQWDVTDIVRNWYEGENTGMMFKNPDSVENAGTESWKQFYSSDYGPSAQPTLVIMFRNNSGLENYWDYTTSSAGRAGTGYINQYTGNLVWVRNEIGFGGNRMPVSVSRVYNANDSLKNEFGLGYGWRTNYNQRVYHWNSQNAEGDYYVWEDADGTSHYFLYESSGVYKDEDGLELTLKTTGSGTKKYSITDKYGNTSYFDTYGRLTQQTNNQKTVSSITITYTTASGYKISTITDGAERVYSFSYNDGGNVKRISYKGTGSTEIAYNDYAYHESMLTTVTYQDGLQTKYTYTTNHMLAHVEDVDGYKLSYGYNRIATGQPSRVSSVTETDDGASGGALTIAYAQNQTTFTDQSGNMQTIQFNNWGNTIAVFDNQGRAQYTQYALNDIDEDPEDSTEKGNQLQISSKLQNTVGNVLDNSSFETPTSWTATSSAVTCSSWAHTAAIHGNQFLRLYRETAGSAAGACSPSFAVAAGETYTFSAYVRTGAPTAYLELNDGTTSVASEVLPANTDFTRLEVSYTASSAKTLTARLMTTGGGTIFMDCAQIEKAPTASRYNLVENGDFRHSTTWSSSAGRTTLSDKAPAAQLSSNVYKLAGSPTAKNRITQTIKVKGSANDSFVLAAWAKAASAPLSDYDTNPREFGIIATFNNTDGTSTTVDSIHFNPYVDNWQYIAVPIVAKSAYSSITLTIAYDYNVNTAYFDGIQLYKEEFGSSYTYDSNGNVVSVADVQKQNTKYEYTSNNLTKMTLPSGATLTYTYDSYHNVLTATTSTGVIYNFTYDTYGNNTQLSIVSGSTKITSKAAYTSDGNYLVSTTDASGNTTTYSYDTTTGNLNSVQYPNDSTSTLTQYVYDANTFRLKSASVTTDSGQTLTASYTYTADQLTKIQTKSTAYTFNYGSFGLRSSVLAGTRTLASYTYTSGTNYLARLDYGNKDKVQYTYDTQGRLTSQSYETGDTVKYEYNNDGALAVVDDKGTGIKTKYYYDLANRLAKYTEEGSNTRNVQYTYDASNNLSKIRETVFGKTWTSSYAYDTDNRMTSSNVGTSKRNYTYDSFGRLSTRQTVLDTTVILTDTYQYNGNTSQVKSIQKSGPKGDGSFSYTYDKNGNIQSVTSVNSSGTNAVTYTYDSANQLTRENNQKTGKTTVWTYDNAGNIKTRKEYAYTTGTLGTATSTVNYAYADSKGWGDLLTSYNGQSISYDEIGNPTSYYNGTRWTMTWERGRQLATMSDGTTTWTNTYSADGLRTQRTDGTTTYTYTYDGGRLTGVQRNDLQMWIFYDDNGPTTLKYGTGTFHYVLNLQGDVVALLGADGRMVVEYTYDAWGNVIDIEGEYDYNLGIHNPIRYRGYIYDTETGLYYCQSRYYDSETGRFINSDALSSTGQGIIGNNMFAYCGNNPVNNIDPTGLLYTPTELHNFVLQEICDNDPNKTYQNTHMVYTIPYWKGKKFSYYGYCDLYDTVTHEIWDAKHFMGGITCTKLYAMAQVSNYVNNGTFTKQLPAELKIGGSVSTIDSNCFIKKDRDGQGNYVMWYWDAGDGVVFYDYSYIPSGSEVLGVGICVAIGIAFATGNIPLGSALAGGGAVVFPIA